MKLPLTVRAAEQERLEGARSCGPCHACCVLPRILPGLGGEPLPDGKVGYAPCPYLTTDPAARCGVYAGRPAVCREFACLWRDGYVLGDERRRPDNLGLMFTAEAFAGRAVLECWELWEGAARDHPGRGVLEALAAEYVILLRYYGVPASVRYYGPESLLAGGELSRLAREDPPALAAWLERQVEAGRLEDPHEALIHRDVESLKEGTPVRPHFGRGGQPLSLPQEVSDGSLDCP